MENLLNGKLGTFYKIHKISYSVGDKVKRRLLDLGFTKGEKIRVVGKSLLKKAYLIEIRGYTLTLKKDIVSCILVDF